MVLFCSLVKARLWCSKSCWATYEKKPTIPELLHAAPKTRKAAPYWATEGSWYKVNTRNPLDQLKLILEECKNEILDIIESCIVGIHTVAVDARPNRRITVNSAKQYALILCEEYILLGCGGIKTAQAHSARILDCIHLKSSKSSKWRVVTQYQWLDYRFLYPPLLEKVLELTVRWCLKSHTRYSVSTE